jgi:hypothetical protein
VKPFVTYTLLRLLLFIAVFAVVLGMWILAFGEDSSIFWPLLIGLVVSGVLSIFLLNKPREQFAEQVEARARRAAHRFDEMKAREDDDTQP